MNINESPPAITDPLLPYAAAMNTYLNCGRSTADKMLKNKEIAAIRIGGRWMVRLSTINAYVAAAEAATEAKRRAA